MFALKVIVLMSSIAHACSAAARHRPVDGLGRRLPFTFMWIYASLILFAVAFLAGLFVMVPSAKRRIAILSERGPSDPEFIALSQRAAKLGPALSVLALIIVWLMVVKPL